MGLDLGLGLGLAYIICTCGYFFDFKVDPHLFTVTYVRNYNYLEVFGNFPIVSFF